MIIPSFDDFVEFIIFECAKVLNRRAQVKVGDGFHSPSVLI